MKNPFIAFLLLSCIFGGIAGFFIGGPIGIVIGVFAGPPLASLAAYAVFAFIGITSNLFSNLYKAVSRLFEKQPPEQFLTNTKRVAPYDKSLDPLHPKVPNTESTAALPGSGAGKTGKTVSTQDAGSTDALRVEGSAADTGTIEESQSASESSITRGPRG